MPEIEVTPEHAADPYTRRVGILVGVVGILLSVVTIASHRAHTDAVIHRTESNDEWAYYQAKKIREYSSDVGLTLLQTLGPDPAKTAAPEQKLTAARDRYASEAVKIQTHGRRTRSPSSRSAAPCVTTSARACWSLAWCCVPCIFWRARVFSRFSV